MSLIDITGKNRKKPASTGQPYEVVLEGDTDSIVTKMLTPINNNRTYEFITSMQEIKLQDCEQRKRKGPAYDHHA